jgi:light-regulated signal transduction histidine kinase (bacteriophytochrome)
MEEKLKMLFEYSHDAVLIVEGNHIAFANIEAKKLFGSVDDGRCASSFLPAYLLSEKAERFVTSMDAPAAHCSVSAARMDKLLVLTIHPEKELAPTGYVSDALLSSMTANLCNIGISARLLSQYFREHPAEKSASHLAILYHNYYCLKRLVGNLRFTVSQQRCENLALPRITDLTTLCAQLVSSVSLMLGRTEDISFCGDEDDIVAFVDPDLIERMLLNLLVNSCRYTPAGKSIVVCLKRRENQVVISVDDTGCGISPQILKNVFTRYEEPMPDDLSAPVCTGLGLGIARGIAELNGGCLVIESREGAGTHVRVMLPAESEHLSSPVVPYPATMDNILTELSCLLDSHYYTEIFLE